MATITVKPIQTAEMQFTVRGISPLIHHNWDEKSKAQLRDKHAGVKTKNREKRNPQAEFEAAMYRTADGSPALPAMSIKKAVITAAHKDIGIEKTLVRKALFFRLGGDELLSMRCSEPLMREDTVRVGVGSTDLRYRPEYREWEVDIDLEYDAELLTPETILTLFDRAGFGVGIGEMRPERDGEYGRFEVARDAGVNA